MTFRQTLFVTTRCTDINPLYPGYDTIGSLMYMSKIIKRHTHWSLLCGDYLRARE